MNQFKTIFQKQNETQTSKEQINTLHLEFQTYGLNAKEWIQKCKMLLPKIQQQEVWRAKGFANIYEYARVFAGMSTYAVDDALWIMKKLDNRPMLQKIAQQKGINAVRPVLTIVTEESEKFWATKTMTMSKNTLETYVKEYKGEVRNIPVESAVDNGKETMKLENEPPQESCTSTSQSPKNRITKSIYMKLNVKTIERLKKIKGEKEWDEFLNYMLDSVEKGQSDGGCANLDKLANQAFEEPKPEPVNTGKRYIPAKIKKYVVAKTSGHCAYPGCSKPYEILHHTERFALDGAHDPDTLVPLCKSHERLAHAGLIEGEEGGVINWCVRLNEETKNAKYKIDKKVNLYYVRK
ncbi:MAG: HNH endonuclease signature motif containing protein [Candidatus Peregrinibacteria bacterium]|nr:HNH endonuclease signature motif containing protein [Candidatus Peregrinibacteria bacterium]MDZ4244458.1 HNH endonuclease signature motif containing protein [Candidatus Gracilibacteria bacterium]